MEKRYEREPYLSRFTAQVESCVQGKKGWDVILNETAFYPEGGGQPWDTGTLGGVPVLEVHSRDGRVVHTCQAPLTPGTEVEGVIDWERRFDLMQHHSGEHIVSGLAHAMFGCDNVGFHMGSDVITIDLNVELDAQQLQQLEQAANRYIWEDHPISITYPGAGDPGIPQQEGPHWAGAHRLLPRGGHLCLLRHPRVLFRPGGSGEAAHLPEIPLRRAHRAGVRWTGHGLSDPHF